jgi:glutamate synthase (ferredoxin)
MMRACHLNTCPVLLLKIRVEKEFQRNPEHIINFITEELREIMAQLGFRTLKEMVDNHKN